MTEYATGHLEKRIKARGWSDDELVDVRTMGKSMHNQHFCTEELAASLQQKGIAFSYPGNL